MMDELIKTLCWCEVLIKQSLDCVIINLLPVISVTIDSVQHEWCACVCAGARTRAENSRRHLSSTSEPVHTRQDLEHHLAGAARLSQVLQ